MTIEQALIIKTTPKLGSKRNRILENALHAKRQADYSKGLQPSFNICEMCGKLLFNPRSILIHQGGGCQKKISLLPNGYKSN